MKKISRRLLVENYCIGLCLVILLLPNSVVATDLSAQVQWHQRVLLSTLVSGVVAQVLVEEGSTVKKGESMLKLSDIVYKARVLKLEVQVVQADQDFQEAQRELERNTELFEQTMISVHELELVKLQFITAKASLQSAKSSLIEAQTNLKFSEIVAPFDGIVVKRNAEEGQTIVSKQNAPILIEFASTNKLKAIATVSADRVRGLNSGKKVTVKYGKKRFIGFLQNASWEPVAAQSKSGKALQYTVNIVFDNNGYLIPIGSTVKVSY